MPIRFGTQYQCKRLDNLGDPEWHNSRWQDIDLRMAAREKDATKIDDAVDQMEAIALSRLNDTFSPLIKEAMDQLASVGVSFTGQSLTTNTIGLGLKTFIITEQYRTGMVVVDYVSIRPTGVVDAGMICSVTSYDRTTGILLVDPQEGYTTGSGTYSDWSIRVSVTPNLDTYSRAEVDDKIDAGQTELIDGAPDNMNTLGKIAVALGGQQTGQSQALTTVLTKANNLSDLLNTATARSNLGLGSVDNTRDANKPVSAAQQQAMNAIVAAAFPVGTTMLFYQAVVPNGWIRMTSQNDKTIRVVSGTGGVAGGVQPFSTAFGRTSVDYHTLDGNELTYHAHGVADPGHAHSVADPGHGHGIGDPTHVHGQPYSPIGEQAFNNPAYQASGGQNYYGSTNTDAAYTGIWIGASGVGIGIYGAGTGIGIYAAGANYGHTHGIDIRVQYCDVIIGVKS